MVKSKVLFLFYTLGFSLFSIPCVGDDSRLLKAEADNDNWLTYGHGYSNQRFSLLKQINRYNVAKIKPAWIYQTGILGTFPTNPLVVDGSMIITTPYNHVISLNSETGKEQWRYQHQLRNKKLCCGSHNRGAAWGYGRLYMVTVDGRFISLDADNGEVVWDIPVVDPMTGNPQDLELISDYNQETQVHFDEMTRFSGNMAPVVYDGKVFVGVSGTGYSAFLGDAEVGAIEELGKPGVRSGLRAFLTAYDAATGKLIWRWYSTASKNWEGEYTTHTYFGDKLNRDIAAERKNSKQYVDAWKTGGGSIYSSPTIDPKAGLIFFGTGNPSPTYSDEKRPGDNLYTSALVALDLKTGKLAWYHQIVPHDVWGYDVAAPPVLVSMKRGDGKNVEAIAAASKTGRVYFFERANGNVLGRSEMFVPKNENMFRRPTVEGIEIAPGAAGGANWPPLAYNKTADLLYIPAAHRPTWYQRKLQTGGNFLNVFSFDRSNVEWGTLSAISPKTKEIKWQIKTELAIVSGVLATDGGLLFCGESDGRFVARDSLTGERLWDFETGAGVNAPPITYRNKGRQYVAVASGGHSLFGYRKGNAIIAFTIP